MRFLCISIGLVLAKGEKLIFFKRLDPFLVDKLSKVLSHLCEVVSDRLNKQISVKLIIVEHSVVEIPSFFSIVDLFYSFAVVFSWPFCDVEAIGIVSVLL